MSIQEQFEQLGHKQASRNGATIGDGMRASARTAAFIGGFTLLLQATPMFLAAITGCVFFFRSCRPFSAPVANHAPIPVRSPVYAPTPSPAIPSSSDALTRQDPSPIRQAAEALARPAVRRSSRTEPDPNAVPTPRELHAQLVEESPGMVPEQEVLVIADVDPVSSAVGQQAPYGFGNTGSRRAAPPTPPSPFRDNGVVQGMVGESFDADELDDQGVFEEFRGGTFVGTSQMEGQPSERIQLTIDRIRDGGSNVRATMVQLEGSHKRRVFDGLIEGDPPYLTLIPRTNSRMMGGGFGVASPWHGDMPQRIHLDIMGKTLMGETRTRERFVLFAKEEVAETQAQATPPLPIAGNGIRNWKVVSRNGSSLSGEETWHFRQTSPTGRGRFVSKVSGRLKTSGRYVIQSEDTLNLYVLKDGRTNTFRCRIFLRDGDLTLCIPEADARQPSAILPEHGLVLKLVPSPEDTP